MVKMEIFKILGILGPIASISSFILAIVFVYYPSFVNVPTISQSVAGGFTVSTITVPVWTILAALTIILTALTIIVYIKRG